MKHAIDTWEEYSLDVHSEKPCVIHNCRGGLKMRDIRCTLYILLVMLVFIPSCTSSRTGGTITDKGNFIELATTDLSMKALKKAPIEDTFVLFSVNPVIYPDSLKYLDGRIIAMPKKDADQLKAQYGNFVFPENKGHNIAKNSIRYISLIAADGKTQKKIKKLIDLNSQRKFPLIKASMTELQVTELLYKKSKVLLSGEIGKNFLISKVEILEENYPF
jgi:hypothetical protein